MKRLPLVLLLAACSSTGVPDPDGDPSTAVYRVPAPEAAERVRTYLQSRWFRMSYADDARTRLEGFLATRRPMDRIDIVVTVTPAQGDPGLARVVVSGDSAGGDAVVRQWQMRVHRHLRALYPGAGSR